MLKVDGVPDDDDVRAIRPSAERRASGPVVWVECFEEIPCDPCHDACPTGAIGAFDDINDLPAVDHGKCNGCGLCVPACPGLAIFIIDETYSEDEAVIRLPYEFTPLPERGDEVTLLTRAGEEVGAGTVQRVQNPAAFDHTAVVWVVIPRELAGEVRAIRRELPDS